MKKEFYGTQCKKVYTGLFGCYLYDATLMTGGQYFSLLRKQLPKDFFQDTTQD